MNKEFGTQTPIRPASATGPGHSAIGYGQYPGKIGVIGNSFYDRDLGRNVNCVEDPLTKVVGAKEGKLDLHQNDFNGLGDWLKSSNPNSKVIPDLPGKDRAACLLGAKNPIYQFIITTQEVLFLQIIMLINSNLANDLTKV